MGLKIDRNDIVGRKFGRLTVCSFSHSDSKTIWYRCRCECGKIVTKQKSHLLHYKNITCGDCTKIIPEADYMRYVCRDGSSFIFDKDDLSIVRTHRWCIEDGYVECNVGGKTTKLHRVLLNAKESDIADHINGNTRDNRKRNLRIASHAENNRNSTLYASNTTGYKGVYRLKSGK